MNNDCYEWPGLRSGGYGVIYTSTGNLRAHRVVWEAVNGPIPDGMVIMHTCDNPPCVNPAHLRLGTQAENVQDMCIKGRRRGGWPKDMNIGERHPNARLTKEDVLEIRRLAAEGVSQRTIAEEFATPQANVSRIVQRKRWAHITE